MSHGEECIYQICFLRGYSGGFGSFVPSQQKPNPTPAGVLSKLSQQYNNQPSAERCHHLSEIQTLVVNAIMCRFLFIYLFFCCFFFLRETDMESITWQQMAAVLSLSVVGGVGWGKKIIPLCGRLHVESRVTQLFVRERDTSSDSALANFGIWTCIGGKLAVATITSRSGNPWASVLISWILVQVKPFHWLVYLFIFFKDCRPKNNLPSCGAS